MSTKQIDQILLEHPFFRNLNKDYLKLIAGCGVIRHFKENEYLAKEADPANNFFVILHGSVAIETFVNTRGHIVLQTVEHEVIGWSWLFPPYKWTFDIKSVSGVSVIALDGSCLREKCEKDSAMGYALMKQFAQLMTRRLQLTRMRLLDVYGH